MSVSLSTCYFSPHESFSCDFSNWFCCTIHNGILDTEKIFKKIELMISMARLTPNLVNASQKSEKKVKKSLENDGI